jgi:aquaporin Z
MAEREFHWGHYAIEAWGLGTFMLVAGAVAVALTALPSPLGPWLTANALAGRAVFGVAMGLTAAAIIYSPWGARSGAHINPAVTLTFLLLRKLPARDAFAYVVAQFVGGVAGFFIIAGLAGPALLGAPNFAIVTKPGPSGIAAAFVGELAISFVLMSVVLAVSNAPKPLSNYAGIAAATLVALFITFEAPFSGMSMNPARTLASALLGHDYTDIWIYFVAPPLGMLSAAFVFVNARSWNAVRCGRISHGGPHPCIFHCTHAELA